MYIYTPISKKTFGYISFTSHESKVEFVSIFSKTLHRAHIASYMTQKSILLISEIFTGKILMW
jgi:hypothetical protein